MSKLACFTLLLLLLAAPALAQTTRISGGEFRRTEVEDDTLNRAGRFEAGLTLAGSLSFGTVTPDGGETRSQTNAYFTPTVFGGVMVTDNIELRLAIGLQYVAQDIDTADTLTNLAGVGALQGLYQADIGLGLALYGGIGLGGFYGTRTADVAGGLEQRYTSGGGLGQVMGGLLMMPGALVLFRGGLRADFLFGWDSPDNGVGPGAFFFTTQILFEVAMGVRFG